MSGLSGAFVIVVGGTGSFGKRVAVTLLKRGARVRVFSRDELKQDLMRRKFPEIDYQIGDVRDYDSVADAMRGVDYVFHAAALKQVPNCERFVMQTVKTNVIGSDNVFRAAIRAGVKTVVALSTDKSVANINVLGASKMLMEKLVVSYERQRDTALCAVRYGNVLGSRGSVVPVFQEQIARGGPITITVPHMTRFLLTLDDAVDLVLYALDAAIGGEVFVKKAPACTVELLAKACIQKYGPCKTVVTGIRPGEKIHETLVAEHELPYCRDAGDYFVLRPNGDPVPMAARAQAAYTSDTTQQLADVDAVVELLERAELATGE